MAGCGALTALVNFLRALYLGLLPGLSYGGPSALRGGGSVKLASEGEDEEDEEGDCNLSESNRNKSESVRNDGGNVIGLG